MNGITTEYNSPSSFSGPPSISGPSSIKGPSMASAEKLEPPSNYHSQLIGSIHHRGDMVTISDEARAMSKAFSAKAGAIKGTPRTSVFKEDTTAIADLNSRTGKIKDEIITLIARAENDENSKRQLVNKHGELVTLYNRLAQLKSQNVREPVSDESNARHTPDK